MPTMNKILDEYVPVIRDVINISEARYEQFKRKNGKVYNAGDGMKELNESMIKGERDERDEIYEYLCNLENDELKVICTIMCIGRSRIKANNITEVELYNNKYSELESSGVFSGEKSWLASYIKGKSPLPKYLKDGCDLIGLDLGLY